MFVRNLAAQVSLLQQKHYNSAREKYSSTAFVRGIKILLL